MSVLIHYELFELYKERNKNESWFKDHSGSATGSHGKMFDLFNTNFRDFKTIFTSFLKFKEIVDIERSKWPSTEGAGQEKHKQYVSIMRNIKLFYEKKIKNEESYFYLTTKGEVFNTIIDGDYTEGEKYFLAFILISDANINKENNYLLEKSKEILNLILVDKLSEDELIIKLLEVLELKHAKLKDYMEKDFFFIHSFYDDQDFIISFLHSTPKEKEELREYVLKNKKDKNYICCLSQKYQNGGSMSGKTFYTEVYTFYMNLLILKNIDTQKENIFNILLDRIIKIERENFDYKKIIDILKNNEDLFFNIYLNLSGKSEEEFYNLDEEIVDIIEVPKDRKEEYLDETNILQKRKIKQVFNSLKKITKKEQGNKCIFDGNINNCQVFTAKATGKNYLELHHLIPREFRNEFGYSIEVLANYIALCPYCHRKIHLAQDRERSPLITQLFNLRKDRLKNVGLEIEEKDLKKFYKINTS